MIAALFANDGAALLLTPIVIAILARSISAGGCPGFIIATGFVADSTSLPLIISNLVNIVSANYFDIGFTRYAQIMVPVDLVSLIATLVVLLVLPPRYPRPLRCRATRGTGLSDSRSPGLSRRLSAAGRAADRPVPDDPLADPVRCHHGRGRHRADGHRRSMLTPGHLHVIPLRKVIANAPWQIVLFSLGMYLVVYGLGNAWLTAGGECAGVVGPARHDRGDPRHRLRLRHPGLADEQHAFHADRRVGHRPGGCRAADSAVDGLRQRHRQRPRPKFTPIGSLATLLWLHVLAGKATASAGGST